MHIVHLFIKNIMTENVTFNFIGQSNVDRFITVINSQTTSLNTYANLSLSTSFRYIISGTVNVVSIA